MRLRSASALAVVACLLASCSSASDRLRSISSHDVDCAPGTFAGSMTINCPERVQPR
jgi:hypothetical protein